MSWFLLIFSEFNDLMWLIGVQLDQAACPGCSTATTRIWSRLTVKASSLSTTWGQHQDASLLGNMIWVPGWLCIHLFGRIPLILPKTADFTWFDYPPPKKQQMQNDCSIFYHGKIAQPQPQAASIGTCSTARGAAPGASAARPRRPHGRPVLQKRHRAKLRAPRGDPNRFYLERYGYASKPWYHRYPKIAG